MTNSSRQRVVLLHGLGESPATMWQLEVALRGSGYAVSNIAYPSTLFPMEHLVERNIIPLLEKWEHAQSLHFVTHSLGGVLLHAALDHHRPSNLGRVVMTAPGLGGSDALEVYRRDWSFRMIFGPSAFQSGTREDGFFRTLQRRAEYDLGIIAGCVSLDPLANLFIPWPHDGKITVAHTRVDGMSDHITLPVPHDLLASGPVPIFQTLSFLKTGHFIHLRRDQGFAPLQGRSYFT